MSPYRILFKVVNGGVESKVPLKSQFENCCLSSHSKKNILHPTSMLGVEKDFHNFLSFKPKVSKSFAKEH